MVKGPTRYSLLEHITKIINTKSNLHEVLEHVTKVISEEIVQCSGAGIYLPQEDGTFGGFVGKPQEINGIGIGTLVIDPEKDLLVKELIESRKAIYIPDTSKDNRPDPKIVEALEIKSLLALPISFEKELFGLIFLFDSGVPMGLTGMEIKSVEAYVNIAAIAIQNVNHLKQKEVLLAEKQLMLGMSRDLTKCSSMEESLDICFSYMERILGSHQMVAYLLEHPDMVLSNSCTETGLISIKQSLEGIIQDVISDNKAIHIPDILKDERINCEEFKHFNIKSLLVFPFVSLGEVLGVIVVAIQEEHFKYYDCLIQTAQSIVDWTAPVFSNLQYVGRLEKMVEERTRELAVANEKVISVIEGITGGFFALDRDWKITYVNQHQFLPHNKKAEDVIGKNLWEIAPETIDTVMYKELHRAMSERVAVQFEVFSSYEEIWYEIVAYPYEDGICCLFKNITEKKKFENEFKRLSSLDLIGQMAAGISHEIRNPMATVRGFLQLLKMDNDFGKQEHYFEIMIEELDRANSIITEFLSIGNTKTSDMKMLDLNTIIFDMCPLMEVDAVTQNKMIEVETEDVPYLLLNHNEIRQLIMNIYRNGLEAMEEGKTLLIRTYKENDSVVLAVRDQGIGISQEVMEKLGTPFFTTKDNGTGLGLGVCYAIAARHNAKIEIETGNEGTTFFIKFNIGHRTKG
ncbi:MAG TPA: ATPase [Bacillus bacterium]|uniref:histidine kinase n=1 Tax=Siminovitchia fordii TaxID=254759 RepID=A0ABQ4K6S8_9BACI|nr:GAF domain-containing protein [Siminovitchia fordii]GIN21454.1 ATPase [Siminovitchia fordii]HBZ08828.1 ATPase [Bacillus sp. (in: firmicutes)]